jgi:hypothetical protein
MILGMLLSHPSITRRSSLDRSALSSYPLSQGPLHSWCLDVPCSFVLMKHRHMERTCIGRNSPHSFGPVKRIDYRPGNTTGSWCLSRVDTPVESPDHGVIGTFAWLLKSTYSARQSTISQEIL